MGAVAIGIALSLVGYFIYTAGKGQKRKAEIILAVLLISLPVAGFASLTVGEFTKEHTTKYQITLSNETRAALEQSGLVPTHSDVDQPLLILDQVRCDHSGFFQWWICLNDRPGMFEFLVPRTD